MLGRHRPTWRHHLQSNLRQMRYWAALVSRRWQVAMMSMKMTAPTSSTSSLAAGTCSFALSCYRYKLLNVPRQKQLPACIIMLCASWAADGLSPMVFVICIALANFAMVSQATFFIAATVAARLGTAALAAYAVISQLWVLASYVVDGFAVAGTVLGSRLVALRHQAGGSAVQVRDFPRCPALWRQQAHKTG